MKIKGFTLVELLAVIVILAIILAIAIPGISGLIENSRKSAFEDSVKLIIKSVDTKRLVNGNYDVTELSASTMEDDLGVGNENYQSISATVSDDNINIDIVGRGKWEGLEAHGTLNNLIIGADEGSGGGDEGGEETGATIAPDSCFTFDAGTGTITDYNFDNPLCPTALIIPNTIGGINVEHIGPAAFIDPDNQWCYNGSGANNVGISYVHTEGDGYDRCWYGLMHQQPLTSVTLPSYLETIDNQAFYYNVITSLIIPNSVTTIADGAFSENQLTSLTLGNSVQTIGNNAFYYSHLTSINIPSSVTSIGDIAFYTNKLTSLSIPNTVTHIGKAAFNDNLLPDNQAFIYARNGDGSIDNSTLVSYGGATKGNVNIPSGVITLSEMSLENSGITSVTIPNTVTTIAKEAFRADHLINIVIPDSVTTIGQSAFEYNQAITLTLGNNITTIGEAAFLNNQITGSLTIPNSVTTIGDSAFLANQITSLTLGSGLTTIAWGAFEENLFTSIVIPSNVTSIGTYAFSDVPLTSVTIQGANPQRFNGDWVGIGFPIGLRP